MSTSSRNVCGVGNLTFTDAAISVSRYVLVLLIHTLVFGAAAAQEIPVKLSQYAHAAWRLQDGFLDSTPQAIAQTRDGYLWIGTVSGLVRFDGVNFVPWKDAQTGVSPANIFSLLASRDGSLWIGQAGALSHLQNGKLTTIPGPLGRVNRMLQDDHGTIWLVRSRSDNETGSLCEVRENRTVCHGMAEGINCRAADALTRDANGIFWVGNEDSVCSWRPGSASNISMHGLQAPGIGAFLPQRDGSLLVGFLRAGQSAGLQRLAAGKFRTFTLPGFDGSKISAVSLLRDRYDGIWIGTLSQGLFHIDHGVVDHFGTADGLSSDDIEDIFEDREGDVWIATSAGVDQFHRIPIISFSMEQGLSSSRMLSVITSGDGRVFAGSPNGLQILNQGKATAILPKDGLPAQMVTSIAQDALGDLWMGVKDRLAKYSHGQFRTVSLPDQQPIGPISVVVDAKQTVWILRIGHEKRLLQVSKNLAVRPVPLPVATTPHEIFSDGSGGIWLTARFGKMFHYVNGTIEALPEAPGKPTLNELLADGADTLWVSTGSKGLYRWKNKKWETLSALNGLPCDDVDSMIEDRSGSLWVDLACGFIRIPKSEIDQWESHRDYRPKYTFFGASDGARPGYSTFSPSTARSPSGQLWFVNDSALLMVDPDHLEHNPVPPPVHILEMSADRVTYPISGTVRLPALTRDISIAYAGLSLRLPKAVRFRYQLSSVDKDWQDVGGRRQAFYMNLRPGRYTFRVIACNNDGVWNMTGDQFTFVILPAFYQTAWFRALVFLGSLLLIWIIFRLRVRAATALVESRMGERLMERDRIARELHDTLLQGFQGLLLQLQTAIRRIPVSEPERGTALRALDRGDEILLEGRERVRDLRSHEGSSGPLVEMLEKVVDNLQTEALPVVDLTILGEPRTIQLFAAEEVSLFAREALSNAIRHSHGTHVQCELHFQAKNVSLIVQDNGTGIPLGTSTGAQKGHWGLQGMRERSAKLNAKMNIETGESGTRIQLLVPHRVAYARTRVNMLTRLRMAFGF